MESKKSKENLTELLKQLAELKRKKALKERKLQKLKGCSVKDIKELRKDQVSSRKTADQKTTSKTSVAEDNTDYFVSDNILSENSIPFKKHNCNSHIDSKHSKCDSSEITSDKDISSCKKIDSVHFNSSKLNETFVKNHPGTGVQKLNEFSLQQEECTGSYTHTVNKTKNSKICDSPHIDAFKNNPPQTSVKTDFFKSDVIHTKTDKEDFMSRKPKPSIFDENKFIFNNEKSSNVEKLKSDESVIKNEAIVNSTKDRESKEEKSDNERYTHALSKSNNFKISGSIHDDVFKSKDSQMPLKTYSSKSDVIHAETDKEVFVSRKRKSSSFNDNKFILSSEKPSNMEKLKSPDENIIRKESVMNSTSDKESQEEKSDNERYTDALSKSNNFKISGSPYDDVCKSKDSETPLKTYSSKSGVIHAETDKEVFVSKKRKSSFNDNKFILNHEKSSDVEKLKSDESVIKKEATTNSTNDRESKEEKSDNESYTHALSKSNNFKISGSPYDDVLKSNGSQTPLKTYFSKSDVIHLETDKEDFTSRKRKSSIFHDNKFVLINEKSNAENLKSDVSAMKNEAIINPISDRKGNNEELSIRREIVSKPVPASTSNFKTNSSQSSSHSSKKSSLSSKTRSSDMLNDSLNEKMSILSCDLFDNNYNDEKETNENCKDVCSVNIDCLKEKENSPKVVCPGDKTALPVSSKESPSASPENDVAVFNFPKFSTPTGDYRLVSTDSQQFNKDEEMIENVEMSEATSSKASKNAFCITEIDHTLEEVVKDDGYSPKKFDTLHISDNIIGKRLSSVLDAHFKSPDKTTSQNNLLCDATCDLEDYCQDIKNDTVLKKRKLFANITSSSPKPGSKIKEPDIHVSHPELDVKLKDMVCKQQQCENLADDNQINDIDFDKIDVFGLNSDSFIDSQDSSKQTPIFAHNSCDDVSPTITETIDKLVTKVCEDSVFTTRLTVQNSEKNLDVHKSDCVGLKNNLDGDTKVDAEIQVIPETEGLGIYFSKASEDFLETSTLSQTFKDFHADESVLNISPSKLKSPVINNIISAIKSSKTSNDFPSDNDDKHCNEKEDCSSHLLIKTLGEEKKVSEKVPEEAVSAFENTLGLETPFLEDETQDLGHFKQVPYMNEVNVEETSATVKIEEKTESSLNFSCSLSGTSGEPVIDVEVVVFSSVKYAFIQHATHIHAWRQEKNKGWIKIFSHQIEDMLSLVKICVSMDDDNLVIVMLLSDDEKYCLQFLFFEKEARVIKLMENTHWLEYRYSRDSILLCGLNGLMFATVQNKENSEVSLHALINLKENPRLMTAVLGSTEHILCSLCKIDKLPNALMGISDSMLYVWHILEARLVTAVPLHPHDYLTIKECFWATVENGLLYFLTTCEGKEDHKVCQLLAVNLATGYCESAATYSTLPSNTKVAKIIKAAYVEPFLVLAHSNGAYMWSVTEEFCCAALSSKSNISTIAISKDFENWGLIVLGSKLGCIHCYSIN